jgi:hypothetical protein
MQLDVGCEGLLSAAAVEAPGATLGASIVASGARCSSSSKQGLAVAVAGGLSQGALKKGGGGGSTHLPTCL